MNTDKQETPIHTHTLPEDNSGSRMISDMETGGQVEDRAGESEGER